MLTVIYILMVTDNNSQLVDNGKWLIDVMKCTTLATSLEDEYFVCLTHFSQFKIDMVDMNRMKRLWRFFKLFRTTEIPSSVV